MTKEIVEGFREWAAGYGLNLRREEYKADREYFYEITETAWRAWLARGAPEQPAGPRSDMPGEWGVR